MHFLTDFIASVLRTLFKLVLLAAALLMIVSVLAVGVLVALLTAVWSLLSGRKPAVVTTFMRFRQTSEQFRQGAWRGHTAQPQAAAADVVDVQSREVPQTLTASDPSGPTPQSRN